MSRETDRARRPGKGRRFRAWTALVGTLSALGLVGLLAAWPGCTVTKDNYKTLSFFFDGVPDPNASTTLIDPTTGEVRAFAIVSSHKPFIEEKCDECHAQRFRLSKTDSTVCLKCHADVPSEHEHMHGPVAVAACLWCHNPHESSQPHLLVDTDRKVCSQCHVTELLDAVTVPEHAQESRACLECHTGHGGPRGFLLREGVSAAPAPARGGD